MTAFDGQSSKVSVFFDSDGSEILMSLSDDPEDQAEGYEDVIKIQPEDIPTIIQDLVAAYSIRAGKGLLLMASGNVISHNY